ncbi:MAG TPA: heavy metal-binding domain-containing protein [Polyangiaceae bacterium]|nr:heavy metal-binding domain-containing protein [Polyangiaceae bacterium]
MAHRPIDLAASIRRVAAGGIPLRAEERLAEEAGSHAKLFTSDLSVNEFLLVRDAGCHPIAQVMGSSIYHVGQIPDYKGKTAEIEVISEAHRESRRRALSRLFQEAVAVGADAVVGAQLRERPITMGARGKGGDDGGGVIEFTVVGTAIKAPFLTHPPGHPIITDLSGQDLWALLQEGWEPCAFLFDYCKFHGWHVTSGNSGQGEVTAANDVVETARQLVMQRLTEQALAASVEFVVGSDVSIEVKEVPCGYASCKLDDLDVLVSWFGTGIRRIPGFQAPVLDLPPLILSMMPLGKRRDTSLGSEDDDASEVERAGEEAEENALELDEANEPDDE